MLSTVVRADVGTAAPNFVLTESGGRRVELSDLRGHPVILAFCSQSWDPSRADQLAQYNALVARVPGTNARLLGISSDGMWCKLAFEGDEIGVPLLADLDPTGAVAEEYGVAGENALVVIDAWGTIRWKHWGNGRAPINTDEFVAALTALAPDPQSPRGLYDERAQDDEWQPLTPNRREFVATALAAACVLAATPVAARAESIGSQLREPGTTATPISLTVNGRTLSLEIEPRVTLLDALREYAGLTGTKKGCDHGQCGACTVHINGRRQLSCMTFAMMHQGAKITTVEGLANGDALHPMQTAFIKHDGFQCGYCTPGQLMSATALLTEPCGPGDGDVKECMSGNICRCGAYPGIVAAIQEVRTGARA